MNDLLRGTSMIGALCISRYSNTFTYTRGAPRTHRTRFQNLHEHELYGKLSKCMFMRKELDFPGHVTAGEGINVDRSIGVDKAWATPQDLKQLQSFLGLYNH
jgi:hypothetical protein